MFHFGNAGRDFIVEEHTRGFQRHPEVTALTNGFCVVWTDDTLDHCDIGGPDVRAKLFDRSGSPRSAEFVVNSETIDHQRDPKVAGLTDGNFVIIWQDFSGRGGDDCGSGLKAKLFNSSGHTLRDEFLVNADTVGRQYNANLVPLKGGGFVVVWQTGADGASCVAARVFTEAGDPLGVDILVDINSHSQSDHPLVTATTDGGFTVVWSERCAGPFGELRTLKARHFSANGSSLGEEILINPGAEFDQVQLAVTGSARGGFVVVWADIIEGAATKLQCKAFGPHGAAQCETFLITGAHHPVASATLVALSDGSLVLVWAETAGEGGEVRHLVKAIMMQQGNWEKGPVMTLGDSSRDQHNPAVAVLPDQSFVIAWEETSEAGRSAGTYARAQVFIPASH